jgi:hypothetical protein
LIFGWIFLALVPQNPGSPQAAIDTPQIFVSQIAPDFSILTEVSIAEPYVGQQFSIIYRLRAQRSPAAVDVDPQQFPGFWTEAIPISQESTSTARPLKGAVDYLLRQVVAFPLMTGTLQLPPLSLKIKRSGLVTAKRDDWDVIGSSAPVPIYSLQLPGERPPGPDLPFVGGAQGTMSWTGEGRPSILLEVQGTANLALFQPLDWLHPPDGIKFQARLAAADHVASTIDREGRRQLSLIQRQRWIISVTGGKQGQQIGDLVLPLFEPSEKAWRDLRITGIEVPASAAPTQAGEKPNAPGTAAGPSARLLPWPGVPAAVTLLVLGAALMLAIWLRKRHAPKSKRAEESLAALEKKLRTSPRAFLDGAHKLLAQLAEETGRRDDLGARETLLDHCWISVQRYRFNTEPLPPEIRDETMNSIRQLLQANDTGPGK